MVFVQLARQVKVGYFTFTFELQKCVPATLFANFRLIERRLHK